MTRRQNEISRPPPDTPVWIDQALIDRTIAVWQPFYSSPLSAEDAVEMLMSASNLFKTLKAHSPEDA